MAISAWRRFAWLWAATCLLTSGCGCNSSSSTTKPGPPPLSAAQTDDRPCWEAWDKPAVALLLSGETFGYLEPCGCSLTQSGGLSRRAHLERILSEKGWTLVGLDAGGLTKRQRQQDRIKFEAILSGLKQLNYRAVVAGDAELRLQPDYLVGQFTESEGIPFGGMLTSCNVVLFDTPDLGVPKPWSVIEAGGVKIGVTAVLGKAKGDEVAPAGVQTNITVRPAEEALATVVPAIEAQQPDLMILLSHGSTEEALALAEKFPQFQAVLATGGPDEPRPDPKRVGKTLVLQTGHKGKQIGVLGFFPQAEERLKWELVMLDNKRFTSDPRMEQLMKTYQQQLQDSSIAISDELLAKHPSGRTFVGAATCGECHKNAFAKWKETKHARAFKSLSTGRKGQEAGWVSRVFDPECLSCHVTGWNPQDVMRYESGFESFEATPHLAGQQCENCHGPGSTHVELERAFHKDAKSVDREALLAVRKDRKLTIEVAKKQLCIQCHDDENSPEFSRKVDKYWDEVRHPWKD